MRVPMAWFGLGVFLGAWSWPYWTPPRETLLPAALALAVLAALARHTRVAAGAWFSGAVLLGALACAVLPSPPVLADVASVRGTVISTRGREAVIDTGSGRILLRFAEEAPPGGTRLAALTSPSPPPVALPGEPDPATADRRAHVVRRKVITSAVIGPDPPPPPDFSAAKHAGLLLALATGVRADLPESERALLRDTGTTHLLSISGLNIALVAGVAAGLARLILAPLAYARLPRLVRGLPGLAGLLAASAYADLVGWPVSVSRAVWMVGAAAAARALGRSVSTTNALGLAATVVVLDDPAQVGEPAFLLSFGAVAGMILVGPRVTRYLPPDAPWPLRWLATSLAATVGATAGTLPMSAWVFQQLPPWSPLANLVAVPLIGGVSAVGAMGALFLPGPLGALSLQVADLAAEGCLRLLTPLATAVWHPAAGPLGALLLVLILPLRRFPASVGGLLLLALGLRVLPVAGLRVTFLAVGQGDAALIRWPDGRDWLVDGGPPGDAVLRYLRREGVEHLDAIFLSHPDLDHLGGLEAVVDNLPVRAFYAPRAPTADEEIYTRVWATLAAREVALPGPHASDPSGAVLYWPPGADDNDRGLVLLIAAEGRRLLFPGDVEEDAEAWLAPRLPAVDVVKVAHHGSRTSSTAPFIAATAPSLAVISVGAGNPFGHPAPEVVARWAPTQVLRTDENGTITLHIDDGAMSIQTSRGPPFETAHGD